MLEDSLVTVVLFSLGPQRPRNRCQTEITKKKKKERRKKKKKTKMLSPPTPSIGAELSYFLDSHTVLWFLYCLPEHGAVAVEYQQQH